MFRCAQVDENGRVFAVTLLKSTIEGPSIIPLTDQPDEAVLGMQYIRATGKFVNPVIATIAATYSGEFLRCEYRAPQTGALLIGEEQSIALTIDDSDPVTLPVTAGVVEQSLQFEAPGTYTLELRAGYWCKPLTLEVVIP